jgi:hypothetical protein
LNQALFGVLIIGFRCAEPRGLAALWLRIKAYFRAWPFSYRPFLPTNESTKGTAMKRQRSRNLLLTGWPLGLLASARSTSKERIHHGAAGRRDRCRVHIAEGAQQLAGLRGTTINVGVITALSGPAVIGKQLAAGEMYSSTTTPRKVASPGSTR